MKINDTVISYEDILKRLDALRLLGGERLFNIGDAEIGVDDKGIMFYTLDENSTVTVDPDIRKCSFTIYNAYKTVIHGCSYSAILFTLVNCKHIEVNCLQKAILISCSVEDINVTGDVTCADFKVRLDKVSDTNVKILYKGEYVSTVNLLFIEMFRVISLNGKVYVYVYDMSRQEYIPNCDKDFVDIDNVGNSEIIEKFSEDDAYVWEISGPKYTVIKVRDKSKNERFIKINSYD